MSITRSRLSLFATILIGFLCLASLFFTLDKHVAAFQSGTITIVSAASYEANLAPESIAAAFGMNLASTTEAGRDTDPNTPGIQLPTMLAGVTVEIGGIRAPLFGVSPGQINLQIPPNVALGAQPIVARNGAFTSNGTVTIVNVAPGLFSFNANGVGVGAGNAVRIRNNAASFEEIATFSNGRFVTRAIDLGPTSDEVYLSLYGTGWRRAGAGTVRVAFAGVEFIPQFAGAQSNFVGLDQLNILIPRSLLGAGRVNVTLNATGALPSNTVEEEIAGAAGASAPTVNNPAGPVVAADATTLTGNGFAPNAADNIVRVGGVEAQVLSASATSLNIRVPFGAETGVVSVRTAQGEGRSNGSMQVRSSVSGLVETTDRQPLNNVSVRALVGLTLLNGKTGTGGAFVLSELPNTGNVALVTIDGSSLNTTPAYGSLTLNQSYVTQRDNQFASPIALQQVTGTSGQVGGGGSFAGEDDTDEPLSLSIDAFATPKELPRDAWPSEWLNAFQPVPDETLIRIGEITLTLPGNADTTFADGSKRGLITLTQVENSRTPVSLPGGVFSAAIVQITPFGTNFGTGGRLRFPNPEHYPAGTQVRVYRLDQRRTSLTVGRFIQAGFATVSADGLSILTDLGVVTEATYYFVGLPRTITNVVGRVLDADRSPLRRALVRLRGQEAFTDGNGGFILRNVPVANANDLLIVEASYARANGRVDRAFSNRTTPVINGFTNVGDIVMPAVNANQPPVLVVASSLTANAGQTNDFNFLAYDPDEARVPTLNVTGANFATIVPPTANTPGILRLTPTANQVGNFNLVFTATDSQNAVTTRTIAVRVISPNQPPVANIQRVVTDEDNPIQFTLTGSDPNGDALKYLLVSQPSNGTLTGVFPAITYTPRRDFNGTDSFMFKVSDGLLDSAPATVTMIVNPMNDAPVLNVPGPQTVTAGQALNFTISATDPDANQTITFSATNLPSGAAFNAQTRQFSWTPSSTQVGTFTVMFTAMDNGSPSKSDVKSVVITVSAGIGWRQTRGPAGGSVRSLTVSGSAVLAATLEGLLFRSVDNGVNWAQTLNTNDLSPLAALATTGNTVYAAGTTRFYVSNDNGAQFTNLAAGYPQGVVLALAANGNNVFAAVISATNPGIYRSTNGGQTWALVNTGLPQPAIVTALVVNGTTLIAGTVSGQVYRSTDNGTNWSLIQLNVSLYACDYALAVGATFYLAGDGVILRSTDSGATWATLTVTEFTISSLSFAGNLLYAATGNGILTIASNGTTTALGTTGLPTQQITAAVVSGANLLASTFVHGVYRSNNSGQTWTASSNGIIGSVVVSLASGGGFVFACVLPDADNNAGSVARTNDNGQTWTISTNFTVTNFVSSLAYGNNVLLAGTQQSGLFRSTDNGMTFNQTGANVGITDVRSVLANGATMFAGTVTGIYRSTDSGLTWALVHTTNSPVSSLSLVGTTLYAGVALQTGGALLRSTNNGTNWTDAGLAQVVTSVVASGSTLLASVIPNNNTTVGIYVSTNGGTSWTPASSGINSPFAFKLVAQGSIVYAATAAGVYRTTNAGQMWTPFNEGLTNLINAAMLLNGNNLFVATAGSGVFIRDVTQP